MLALESAAATAAYVGRAADGKVEVTVNGLLDVTAITLDPSLFSSADAPATAGFIQQAVNLALRAARHDDACQETDAAVAAVARETVMPARLFAKHSGKAMDITGASTDNAASLIQWPYHGGENQLFRPEPVGGGYFRLVAQHSGKVLDVNGASTDDGAAIIQWDWHGGDNQRWLVRQP